MLGAVLAMRAGRAAFAAINRRDVDTIVGMFTEDGVFEFPGRSAIAGRFVGRTAIRAWFQRWFAEIQPRFTVKSVSVERIFTLGATNTVHVEWEAEEVNRAGEHFHLTGVTTLQARGGKGVFVRDYIPEQDVLERAWPPAMAGV